VSEQDRVKLFAKGADSTLTLVVLAALAIALMVLDRRLGYLQEVRRRSYNVVQPMWALAAMPARASQAVQSYFLDRSELERNNQALRRELIMRQTETLQLRAELETRVKVQALIGRSDVRALNAQIARISNVDLDRYTHRIALDKGAAEGVMLGSVLLDQGGIMGQVIEVFNHGCIAILVSDPNYRVPVRVKRNGLRLYVDGDGRSDFLQLSSATNTADVREGDVLLSSGLGGIFPSGLPVGVVQKISYLPGQNFLSANVLPAAKLSTSAEVLILPPAPVSGPGSGPVSGPGSGPASMPVSAGSNASISTTTPATATPALVR
jgi:rod shape-determining protein MreC